MYGFENLVLNKTELKIIKRIDSDQDKGNYIFWLFNYLAKGKEVNNIK